MNSVLKSMLMKLIMKRGIINVVAGHSRQVGDVFINNNNVESFNILSSGLYKRFVGG
jgi:hypothetical protein